MGEFMDELLRILTESQVEPDKVRRAEIRIRQQFGGGRVYVGKGTSSGKVMRLADAVAAGAPLRAAFDTAGVSRRHGYRLLGRTWRR